MEHVSGKLSRCEKLSLTRPTHFQTRAIAVYYVRPVDCSHHRPIASGQTRKLQCCRGNLTHRLISLSFPSLSQIDRRDRLIFMWKIQAREQKEKASDMRRRNEALVYNVLPVHVAEHFMSNKKRSYDELYSQSYAEVGVLFASMPNFSGNNKWIA